MLAFRDLLVHTDFTYNKYLRPVFVSALEGGLRDESPENRRNGLSTFAAAARSKAELTMPNLSQLLPLVLQQTVEDPNLIREISIGPFKQKVDDGLEARKAAYETLYSLLEQSPKMIANLLPQVLPRVVAGISDEPSIRSLAVHMLVKLAGLHPAETSQWLDDVSERFRKILSHQLKDTAVRTEIEQNDEAKRSVVKTSVELSRKVSAGLGSTDGVQVGQGGIGAKWHSYMQDISQDSNWAQFIKNEEKELQEREM